MIFKFQTKDYNSTFFLKKLLSFMCLNFSYPPKMHVCFGNDVADGINRERMRTGIGLLNHITYIPNFFSITVKMYTVVFLVFASCFMFFFMLIYHSSYLIIQCLKLTVCKSLFEDIFY